MRRQGWGPTGPYAYKGGQDLLAQALSGMMDLQAPPGGVPAKVNNPIADFTCGMYWSRASYSRCSRGRRPAGGRR